MSIRYQILLPLLVVMALAGLLAGITGFVGLGAVGDLSRLAERTAEATETSRAARDQFLRAESLVARVSAMTDFLDMAPIRKEFTAAGDRLTTLLGRLEEIAPSEPMRVLAGNAQADAQHWRGDAEILLGIRQAREVPVQERMAEQSRRLRQRFDEAVALAAADAKTQMEATRAATAWKIWAMLGLGGGVILVGSITAWVLAGTLARPLVRLTAETTRLAGGDTSVALAAAHRRDEIGAIARAVVAVRDSSRAEAARELEAAEAGRLREAQARRAMLHDLADQFERSVGRIVAHVAQAATGLQDASGTMRLAVDGTASRSTSAAEAAQRTAGSVDAVAAAAELLGSTAREIGQEVAQAAGMSSAAVQAASRTEVIMADLSAAATRIGDVVSLVSAIAGQTNLLALNATIEAARAGEAGRGFAVVAAEVKALATQTATATDEIGRQIGAIQGATSGAAEAIQDITAQIQTMSAVTTRIAGAIDGQGATTREIVHSMSEASGETGRVTADISEVARSAEDAGHAALAVARAADDLADQSSSLHAEIDRFLRSVRAA